MTFLVDGTLGGTFPSWTTATRPASPAVGQMGYNTTIGQFDAYTTNGWVSVATSATAPTSGPAFSVYANINQALTASTVTKVAFGSKDFDTASAFDSTTNYRFTPQVAGYYQLNTCINFNPASGYGFIAIYKNGATYKSLSYQQMNTSYYLQIAGSVVMQMNGSTDYAEVYAYSAATGTLVPNNVSAGNTGVSFSGFLARPA
jgi:hypothetical protein